MSNPDRPDRAPGTTASPARQLEVETKLEIADGAELPDLGANRPLRTAGVASVAAPMVHELDAIYYDTAELDLLSAKLTLRRRTGGEDAGWHLKLPAAAGARTEVTLPLDDLMADGGRSGRRTPGSGSRGDGGGAFRPVPPPLADLVAGAARGRPLVPIARVCNRRTVVHLLDAGGLPLVEIADDRVEASSPDDPTAAPGTGDPGSAGTGSAAGPRRWRELEVELKGGTLDQLTAAVAALRAAGAHPASSSSKLARAVGREGLSMTGSAPGKKAARKARPGNTGKADLSAGAVVLSAVRRLRDAAIVADRLIREDAPGGVRTARSTARRLRSVLTIYQSMLADRAVSPVLDELRVFGRILAPARDLQVIQRRLTAQLEDEPAEYARPAHRRLTREYELRNGAATAVIAQYLSSEPYFLLLRGLDDILGGTAEGKKAARPAAVELPVHLRAAWRELRDAAELVRDEARQSGDPDALVDEGEDHSSAGANVGAGGSAVHRTRTRAKALRYSLEAVVSALGEPAVVLAAAVEQLQEVLGEHQDAVISAALLVELSLDEKTDGIAGFTFGRLHAFEQATEHGALDDFADAWDRLADGELLDALG